MAIHEHLLTIIEPRPGGDTAIDTARETIERGGTATVVLLITEKVRRDIRDFAHSENLDRGVAEALAVEQFRAFYAERVKGASAIDVHHGDVLSGLRDHLTAGTTAIAVPQHLTSSRRARRLTDKTGIPVHVSPHRAA